MTEPVLDVDDVQQLLGIRPADLQWTVNIVGVVDVFTEVLRFNDGDAVLARIIGDDATHFVWLSIKGENISWREKLKPQMSIVVTHLKPITAYQEDDSELILVTTQSSEWHPCSDHAQLSTIKLKEWLAENLPCFDPESKVVTHQESKKPDAVFVSYKGVVTDEADADKGILELDKKVMLYLSQPCLPHNIQEAFNIGATITIYNAHASKPSQVESLHLYCCAMTSMDIENTSKVTENKKVFSWLSLIQKYGMSWQQIDWIISLTRLLKQKLCPNIVRGSVSQVCYDIVTARSAISSERPISVNPTRCVQKEILDPNHSFCNASGQMCQEIPFHPVTIAKVTEWALRNVKNLVEGKNASPVTVTWSKGDKSYWRYCVIDLNDFSPRWVLVGVLRSNKKTGFVQLVDQTGSVDCVVTDSDHNNNDITEDQSGHLAQMSHHGQLIRVDRCHVAVEHIPSQCSPQDRGYGDENTECNHRTYLLFSMKDTVPIKYKQEKSTKLPVLPTLSVSGGQKTCSCASSVKFTSQVFILLHKDSLYIQGQGRRHETSQLTFYAMAVFIGQPWFGCDCTPVRYSAVPPASPHTYPSRHVALAFHGTEARWYNMLYSGHTYILVKHGGQNTAVFDMHLKPANLKQAVKTLGARQCVMVEAGLHVKEHNPEHSSQLTGFSSVTVQTIRDDLRKDGHLPQFLTVSDLCEGDLAQKLVCIRGVILSRSLIQNTDKHGLSQQYKQPAKQLTRQTGLCLPADHTLKLILSDPETPHQIPVYISSTSMVYPLGLLPGSHIELEKVECRRSAEGRIYGHYLLASSCTVISWSQSASQKQAEHELPSDLHSARLVPADFLCDVFDHETGMVRLVGHVEMVRKVCLQVDCHVCGRSVVKQKCDCKKRNSAHVFSAKASITVDDGTGTAIVHCNDEAVRNLLCLTTSQWTALQHAVKMNTSITYDGFSSNPHLDGIEGFLHKLCHHHSVLRSVSVCSQKYTKITSNRKKFRSIHDMTLEDFSQGDVRYGEGSINTYCRPHVNLQCLSLNTTDATSETKALIAAFQQTETDKQASSQTDAAPS